MNGGTQRKDSSMSTTHTSDTLDERLTALESRIAYQEHWLDTLDQAVAAQETRLTRLERINDLMQRKIREQQQALQEGGDAATPSAEDELPPHY